MKDVGSISAKVQQKTVPLIPSLLLLCSYLQPQNGRVLEPCAQPNTATHQPNNLYAVQIKLCT